MDSLSERIQRIEDIEAIRNLIASYGPLADRGDARAVAHLWLEDGEYDVGGYGIAKGRAAIAALIEGDTHRELMADGCAHILSPHQIDIDGADASAIGYSMVIRKNAEGFAIWRIASNQWRLARQGDGHWLVASRVNRPIAPHRP